MKGLFQFAVGPRRYGSRPTMCRVVPIPAAKMIVESCRPVELRRVSSNISDTISLEAPETRKLER